MRPSVWAGSEAAYYTFQALEDKYSLDRVAYARTPFDGEPELDPTFGVKTDRKGLTVMEMVAGVPVIKLHGSLVTNFRRYHAWFEGEITSYEAVNDAIDIAMIGGHKEILIDVGSPGGAVRGVSGVTKMIARAQKSGISVNAHSDSAAMSAAYWIMSSCNMVTGSEMAEFGSIGTMAVIRTFADTEKNMGVTFTVFKEGDYKAIGNPYEKLSDEDKEYVRKDLKKANSFFLNHVSSNRMISLDDYKDWADGKTFYAGEALRNGLIDRVVDLDDLIGGASANTTGDMKVIGMKIDPKKLAQIAAGADPKTVLTAAEFKQYTANLEEANKTAEQLAADKLASDQLAADKLAADKLAADKLKGEGGQEPEPAATPASTTAEGILAADYREAIKATGRLEVQVETLTAQLKATNEDLITFKAETTSLMAVANVAITKLQTATGSSKVAYTTAADIVTAFNDLNAKMATLFPTSQQSSEQRTANEEESAPQLDYRLQRQAQLNQDKR